MSEQADAAGDTRIDADVLTAYLKMLEVLSGTLCARRARERAGADAPLEEWARALIDEAAVGAAWEAGDDGFGNTDRDEIARWHRRWVDDLCIPTPETKNLTRRIEPDTTPGSTPGLRRWNARMIPGLQDAGVPIRRGRGDGPHAYELCDSDNGWTLLEHGCAASDRERAEHLIEQAPEALHRCARDMGKSPKSTELLQGMLRASAEQESVTAGDDRQ